MIKPTTAETATDGAIDCTVTVMYHPILGDARRTEGFKDIVRDTGLVDYWRASGEWGDFVRPVGDDDFEAIA